MRLLCSKWFILQMRTKSFINRKNSGMDIVGNNKTYLSISLNPAAISDLIKR